jgi:hypothetical protein
VPISAAVLDDPRQVCLSYSLANSLYAPSRTKHLEPREPETRNEQRDVSRQPPAQRLRVIHDRLLAADPHSKSAFGPES